MIELDSSETQALEVDLSDVPARAVKSIEAVTKKAAQNIKDGLREDAESDGHYSLFSGSITYDRVFGSLNAFEFEIGPDKNRRQGALGNILYFGTSRNAPVLDLEAPVRAEEPRFLKELRKAAGDSVAGAL